MGRIIQTESRNKQLYRLDLAMKSNSPHNHHLEYLRKKNSHATSTDIKALKLKNPKNVSRFETLSQTKFTAALPSLSTTSEAPYNTFTGENSKFPYANSVINKLGINNTSTAISDS